MNNNNTSNTNDNEVTAITFVFTKRIVLKEKTITLQRFLYNVNKAWLRTCLQGKGVAIYVFQIITVHILV